MCIMFIVLFIAVWHHNIYSQRPTTCFDLFRLSEKYPMKKKKYTAFDNCVMDVQCVVKTQILTTNKFRDFFALFKEDMETF
jgi:hypothetical protein